MVSITDMIELFLLFNRIYTQAKLTFNWKTFMLNVDCKYWCGKAVYSVSAKVQKKIKTV